MDFTLAAILLGIGATAITDVWSLIRKALLGVPSPNFAFVGRWFAHLARGRFRHESMAAAAPMRGETAIGWIAHYCIGIAFAALLLALVGLDWLRAPTLGPPLLLGIVTVAAPFFILQPGMGAGIAGSRTPHPRKTRLHSVLTHTVFGFGLYCAAWAVRLLS
jgi:hypothetical protein